MKAIQVNEFGGPEVLRLVDVPEPQPSSREALVRIHAIGVNYADITSRIGRYRPDLPWIPGNEAAGDVVEIGSEVNDVAIGDRVAWATAPAGLQLRFIDGDQSAKDTVAKTYAQFAVVAADRLIPVPANMSFTDAAAATMQGITAHYLSASAFSLSNGDRILIHAGAGGVGYLLTQLAKQRGATVYTTVSTPKKAAFSKSLGADEVINYLEEDFLEVVLRLTHGSGLDAVYDSVGAATFDKSLDCLGPCATLLLYGQASGPVPPFDITRLNIGSYFLTRPSIAHYTRTREDLLRRGSEIFNAVLDGELRIQVHSTYSLEEAPEAHITMESRETIGKIILLPQ